MENQELQTTRNQSIVTIGDWIITMILMCIPFVNFIMLLVWAFSAGTPVSKANWAKATLIFMLIGFVLVILFWGAIGGLLLNVKYLAKTLNLYTPDELENKKPFRFWEHFKMLCEFHGINADNEISSFGFMLSREDILSLKYSKSDFNTENLETLFSAKWNVGQVYWSMTKKEAEEYLNYHFKNRKDLP